MMGNFGKGEPKHLKDILNRLIKEYGWEEEQVFEQISSFWGDLVGEQASANAAVYKFEKGKLFIRAMSSTWRTELMLRQGSIRDDINQRLGKELVKELVFR